MTLMTLCDDIFMPCSRWWRQLEDPDNLGEDLVMTLDLTGDYHVMILDDNTDDPCDSSDNLW